MKRYSDSLVIFFSGMEDIGGSVLAAICSLLLVLLFHNVKCIFFLIGLSIIHYAYNFQTKHFIKNALKEINNIILDNNTGTGSSMYEVNMLKL